MIRTYEESDFPDLLRAYKEFDMSGLEKAGLRTDVYTCVASLRNMARSPEGVVLLVRDGENILALIAGSIKPNPFSADQKVAYVAAFDRFHPCGLAPFKLLRRFEQAMTRLGAEVVYLNSVRGLSHSRLKRIYERLGYEAIETLYGKEI